MLQAIQGEDTIWIQSGDASLACEMGRARVHALATAAFEDPYRMEPPGGDRFPDVTPQALSWSRVSALAEGTKLFIAGPLFAEETHAVFRADEESRPLVVFYDGPDKELLARAVWGGRQRNEYWNRITPLSLPVGAIALLLIAFVISAVPFTRLPFLLAVCLASVPVLPLAPPGVLLFFTYRRLWRSGRFLRAQRDLLRLPLRGFRGGTDGARETGYRLPNGEAYLKLPVSEDRVQSLLVAGAVLRTTTIADLDRVGRQAYAFGSPREVRDQDSGSLGAPSDPMAEFVVVPDDPAFLARRCEREAQKRELLAVALFGGGLALNFYLALLLVSNLLP
jgi:hypothetical protein